LARKITYNRLSINKRVLRSIIDFLLIIRNRQLVKDTCKTYRITGDRSDFFVLTGSRKRLYRVLLMILKAVILIRAARKTRLPLLIIIAISCIFVYTFRNINVFLVPVSLLIFRNSYRREFFFRLISLI
jgi:hypothetical protein